MQTVVLALFYVFIFMIPWEDVYDFPGLGTMARFIGIVLSIFWVVKIMTTGRFRKPGAFQFAAGLYVLWNTLSILWTTGVDQTLERLITLAQLFFFSYISWDLITSRTTLLTSLQMYILGAYAALAFTVSNYLAGTSFYYQRFSAPSTNPDDLGVILALGIPVAWYLASSKSTSRLSPLLAVLNYAYIPSALLGIALSGTRTALITALIGMLFGLASLTRIRFSTQIAVSLFLVVAAFVLLPLVPPASLQRLGTTGTELVTGDLNGRIEIWRDGLQSLAKHPLIGVGSSMFRSVDIVGKVAHNSFLSILVETGLIGFALFGIMIIIAVLPILREPGKDALFWLSILLAWTLAASALSWEYRKPTWLFLSLIVAAAALYSHREEEHTAPFLLHRATEP